MQADASRDTCQDSTVCQQAIPQVLIHPYGSCKEGESVGDFFGPVSLKAFWVPEIPSPFRWGAKLGQLEGALLCLFRIAQFCAAVCVCVANYCIFNPSFESVCRRWRTLLSLILPAGFPLLHSSSVRLLPQHPARYCTSEGKFSEVQPLCRLLRRPSI